MAPAANDASANSASDIVTISSSHADPTDSDSSGTPDSGAGRRMRRRRSTSSSTSSSSSSSASRRAVSNQGQSRSLVEPNGRYSNGVQSAAAGNPEGASRAATAADAQRTAERSRSPDRRTPSAAPSTSSMGSSTRPPLIRSQGGANGVQSAVGDARRPQSAPRIPQSTSGSENGRITPQEMYARSRSQSSRSSQMRPASVPPRVDAISQNAAPSGVTSGVQSATGNNAGARRSQQFQIHQVDSDTDIESSQGDLEDQYAFTAQFSAPQDISSTSWQVPS